mmetsp:Transcript_17528/g.40808  ORF Transcript_17528/g.40808 Transcript_17528/m.40808 type:complete len:324 (-) Transcript_17528:72-1043(-)|eukprot:CAMPEP_0178413280 /NCGR_PEP_ID=MMETSP0689_2-20121128/22447_1 /TAXON_ID=160604 /ORGANISM="Amphidinium massartii, Strain CS-259" /LENGTH=323 /DNA_ID=CAMNT_0020034549 /DNA_START=97 /DNA_END=1068 /DNA_ORIENTATION=+
MSQYKAYNDIDVSEDYVLPEGDPVRGQLLFKKHCAQCHTIRRDGLNPYGALNGPNLSGIMGRTAAQNQRTGWAAYSDALKASGILWTDRNMMAFLKNPRMFAGGVVNMNFRGIDSVQDRVDLIHYLKKAGHEEWMVKDGSPHTQKGWWTRGSVGEASYREVHMTPQQLKPWQHLYRGARRRVSEALERQGIDLTMASPFTRSAASAPAPVQQDADADSKAWESMKRVVNGVRPAARLQSFDWPPPEVIADGPLLRNAPAVASSASSRGKQDGLAVVCEQQEQLPSGTEGERAPSGIMVYNECGGPAMMSAAPNRPPQPPSKAH